MNWINKNFLPVCALAFSIAFMLLIMVGCADKRPGDMAPDQTRWIIKHLP